MKTTEELITPEKAQKYLATITSPDQQRKHLESVSDGYAKSMKAGHWMMTHQGIGFDENGVMIDGQHRMWGIVKSGIPQRMMVTRGIPCSMPIQVGQEEQSLFSIDCLDRGRQRSVADQLNLRHGIKNASLVVSLARSISSICTELRMINTVPITMIILDVFGESIEYVAANASKVSGFRSAGFNAVLAMYIHCEKTKGTEFFSQVHYGESIKRGDAGFALRDYLMKGRAYVGTGGGASMSNAVTRASATCAMNHYKGANITLVKASQGGLDWILNQNKTSVAKLRKSLTA